KHPHAPLASASVMVSTHSHEYDKHETPHRAPPVTPHWTHYTNFGQVDYPLQVRSPVWGWRLCPSRQGARGPDTPVPHLGVSRKWNRPHPAGLREGLTAAPPTP